MCRLWYLDIWYIVHIIMYIAVIHEYKKMYLYLVKTCKIYMSYLLFVWVCIQSTHVWSYCTWKFHLATSTLMASPSRNIEALKLKRDAERFAISSSHKVTYQKNSKIEKQHPPWLKYLSNLFEKCCYKKMTRTIRKPIKIIKHGNRQGVTWMNHSDGMRRLQEFNIYIYTVYSSR